MNRTRCAANSTTELALHAAGVRGKRKKGVSKSFARAMRKYSRDDAARTSNERMPTSRVDLEARVKHGVLGAGLVPHDGGAAALLAAVAPMPPIVIFVAQPFPHGWSRDEVWNTVRDDVVAPPGWKFVRDDKSIADAIKHLDRGSAFYPAMVPGMARPRVPGAPQRFVFALRGVQERAENDLVPGADGVLEPRGRTRKKKP